MSDSRMFSAKRLKAMDHVNAIDHYVETQKVFIEKKKEETLKPTFKKINEILNHLIEVSELKPKIQALDSLSQQRINEILIYADEKSKEFFVQLYRENPKIDAVCKTIIKNPTADKMMQEINDYLTELKKHKPEVIYEDSDSDNITKQIIKISEDLLEKIMELQQKYIFLEHAFDGFMEERISKLKAEASDELFPSEKNDKCSIM